MEQREIKSHDLIPILKKYEEQLIMDYDTVQAKIKCLNWDKCIPPEEVRKMAEKEYFKRTNDLNRERNLRKQFLDKERQRYDAFVKKVNQEPRNLLEKFSKAVTNSYYQKALKTWNDKLEKREESLKKVDESILATNEAKIFIKQYSQLIYKNDPIFKENINLERKKDQIQREIMNLGELIDNVNRSDPEKLIQIDGNINDFRNLSKQIPKINKQLNEFEINLGDFEKSVKHHLGKIGDIGVTGSEYQQTIDQVFKLAEKVAHQTIEEKEGSIFKKEEELAKLSLENDRGNIDFTLKIRKLQQEIYNDKKGLESFSKKSLEAIKGKKWGEIPDEIQEKLNNNLDYCQFKNKLSELKRDQIVLRNYETLINKIPNKAEGSIIVEGSYLNRKIIVDQEKTINKELRNLEFKSKNLPNLNKSNKFEI